jgi:hypothetical protein
MRKLKEGEENWKKDSCMKKRTEKETEEEKRSYY